jgi:hypothetical protein
VRMMADNGLALMIAAAPVELEERGGVARR